MATLLHGKKHHKDVAAVKKGVVYNYLSCDCICYYYIDISFNNGIFRQYMKQFKVSSIGLMLQNFKLHVITQIRN